jgi:hypothetical protein
MQNALLVMSNLTWLDLGIMSIEQSDHCATITMSRYRRKVITLSSGHYLGMQKYNSHGNYWLNLHRSELKCSFSPPNGHPHETIIYASFWFWVPTMASHATAPWFRRMAQQLGYHSKVHSQYTHSGCFNAKIWAFCRFTFARFLAGRF